MGYQTNAFASASRSQYLALDLGPVGLATYQQIQAHIWRTTSLDHDVNKVSRFLFHSLMDDLIQWLTLPLLDVEWNIATSAYSYVGQIVIWNKNPYFTTPIKEVDVLLLTIENNLRELYHFLHEQLEIPPGARYRLEHLGFDHVLVSQYVV